MIIFGHCSSEVFRALGKPRLSVLSQVLHLVVLIPVLCITAKQGYTQLYVARSLVRLQAILVDLIILWVEIRISPWKMFKNVLSFFICSIAMGALAFWLQTMNSALLWQFVSIAICILFYFGIICISKENRVMAQKLIGKLLDKLARKGKVME